MKRIPENGTSSVWGGEQEPAPYGAITTPVFHSVGFGFNDVESWLDVVDGTESGYTYSRNGNPTVNVLEEKICQLDEGEAATSFSTGMAAISNTLFALLKPGDRIVTIKDIYGGTNKLFLDYLPNLNIDINWCDTTDYAAIESAIKAGCQLVYLETPTNPTLKVIDLARITQCAHQYGALVIVDNTFASPINQKPLQLGVDLVVYSATKYLNGHSDAMGGLAVGRRSLINTILSYKEITGAALDAQSAYMILRGMKTLELRIQRHNENAGKIADYLSNHFLIEQVFYPGLKTHPDYEIAKKQMSGFGGILSFTVKGEPDRAIQVLNHLKIAHRAGSLGSVETLAGLPKTTSHAELNAEERERTGIPESLIRYSAGIENIDDLIHDLETALSNIDELT
ncbi:aminotransferase class I/II-fold pyridoxal phosphate-dependent enzyme [Vibrio quintilis]|uniref:Cystathionine gamma-synthase n=1 Tax=Vibrio quintilis TaxID=1117707 RepID=A0A1M7YU59_9VIBR|nr:aminotransferase class I/II-fold pyridoxal phosphate-dependent enzyme [Vibrio quintilis]SHO56200.1 Cystathionine gamma-synthase [Vibrio quintilis]